MEKRSSVKFIVGEDGRVLKAIELFRDSAVVCMEPDRGPTEGALEELADGIVLNLAGGCWRIGMSPESPSSWSWSVRREALKISVSFVVPTNPEQKGRQ